MLIVYIYGRWSPGPHDFLGNFLPAYSLDLKQEDQYRYGTPFPCIFCIAMSRTKRFLSYGTESRVKVARSATGSSNTKARNRKLLSGPTNVSNRTMTLRISANGFGSNVCVGHSHGVSGKFGL